jgi:hypothetical protein
MKCNHQDVCLNVCFTYYNKKECLQRFQCDHKNDFPFFEDLSLWELERNIIFGKEEE